MIINYGEEEVDGVWEQVEEMLMWIQAYTNTVEMGDMKFEEAEG